MDTILFIPMWVFLLLGTSLGIGIKSLKNEKLSLLNLSCQIGLFLLISAVSLSKGFLFGAYSAVLFSSLVISFAIHQKSSLKLIPDPEYLIVPGSAITLLVLLLFVSAQIFIAYQKATYGESSLLLETTAAAAATGFYIGRVASYSYQKRALTTYQ